MNEREQFNKSLDHYTREAQITAQLAERTSGVTINRSTIEKWGILYASVSMADDHLDTLGSTQDRDKLGQDLVQFLSGEEVVFTNPSLELAMEKLKEVQDDLPPQKKAIFQRSLKRTLRVTEKMRSVSDGKEFSFLRRLEGQLVMRSACAIIPERPGESHAMLDRMLTRLGRLANMVDSFFDLPMDYKNGETLVPPTIQNRLFLIRSSVKDGIFIFKSLKPSLSLVKEMGWGIYNVSKKHTGTDHLATHQS